MIPEQVCSGWKGFRKERLPDESAPGRDGSREGDALGRKYHSEGTVPRTDPLRANRLPDDSLRRKSSRMRTLPGGKTPGPMMLPEGNIAPQEQALGRLASKEKPFGMKTLREVYWPRRLDTGPGDAETPLNRPEWGALRRRPQEANCSEGTLRKKAGY
jgi:hypothetical protein